MLVTEKYAKNGSKHENGPNWAGSRVQAVRLTRGSLPRRYARMRRDASHLAASRVTPGLGGQRQAIRLATLTLKNLANLMITTPYFFYPILHDANEENLAMIQASDAMLNAWVEQFIVEPQPEPEPQFEPEDLDEEDFDEDPDEDPDEEDDDGPADSGDSHSTIV
ncbi:hypothetical protein E3N88_20171 [Mikania micrantha]|uniref:Uncharacterized protein n=1 Tax=Mikania micrantha TaxID=192012 RepID=A0A5N6NJ25_9ASTR|nr:hypothetical protein E3N88_20171 [Mikania micrantha]